MTDGAMYVIEETVDLFNYVELGLLLIQMEAMNYTLPSYKTLIPSFY